MRVTREVGHTPGPWAVRKYYENGEPGGFTVHTGPAFGLADIPGLDDEAEANARLIAAAPELLDALMEIRKLYLCPQPNTKRAWQALADVMADYARKAIAKAEGRA